MSFSTKGLLVLSLFIGQNVFCQQPASSLLSESDLPASSESESVETPGTTEGNVAAPQAAAASAQMINLDLSQPGSDPAAQLETVLSSQLAGANSPSSQAQTFSINLDVKPPATADASYITTLQNAVKTIITKLAPRASSSIKISYTKTSTGIITDIKLYITVNLSAQGGVSTLAPSTLPQIDLSTSRTGISQSLLTIITNELSQKGYVAGSQSEQNFQLSFNVIPPAGATKDYAKQHVIGTLQNVVLHHIPGGSITSVSVNTQESHDVVLRQTVNFNLRITPTTSTVKPSTNEDEVDTNLPKDAVQTPVVDLTKAGANVNDVTKVLIDELSPSANPDANKQKTLAIPFKITPPAGATSQQIQQNVIDPLEKLLLTLEPTGKILNTLSNVLPNGNMELVIYLNVPSVKDSSIYKTLSEQVNVTTTTTTTTTTTPTTTTQKPSSTPATQLPVNTVDVLPIDLTKSGSSMNSVKEALKKGLQTVIKPFISNPSSADQSQTIGFPVKIPSASVSLIPNLAKTIGTLLLGLEPTGKLLPNVVPQTLSNGDIIFEVYFQLPSVKGSNTYKELSNNLPIVSKQDINLDTANASVSGEVSKAIINGLSVDSDKPQDQDKPRLIDMDVYTPLGDDAAKKQKVVNEIVTYSKTIEPTGEVVEAKVNPTPSKDQPDAEVEFLVPSVSGSKTTENIKNAIKIPEINLNQQGLNLGDDIKNLLAKGLEGLSDVAVKGSQLFNFSFKLDPYNEKGSISSVSNALKAVDPKGYVTSSKIRTGADGFEYLDVGYVIPKVQDSIIYKTIVIHKPKVASEAVVDIDAKKPFDKLLENVVGVVGDAEDNLQGAKKGDTVDLPLNFKITNSAGMSDAQVSQVVSKLLPKIQGYIAQVCPGSKITSAKTLSKPDSDDVYLRLVVRTQYDPDDEIVINDIYKKKATTTTTKKPRNNGIFGFNIFGSGR